MTEQQVMTDQSSVPEDWVPVEMEIDADVLAHFQALGHDWEVRINDALREYLRKHPAG